MAKVPPSHKAATSGAIALVLLAGVYGLTAVMARFLSHGLGLFEQWYLRYGIAFLLSLLIFQRGVDLGKFARLPAREWGTLLFRTSVGSILGIGLYTVAAQTAKIGPVAFMQVVPTTALFALVLFHERLSWKKGMLIGSSFLGAAIVVVGNLHDLRGFSHGELLSLISGALFSLVLVARKWHTNILNNQELTVAMTGLSFGMNYILSLVLYHRAFIPAGHWNIQFTAVILLAGISSVAIYFLMNYGFEHTSALVASSILDLEEVFGALFGYVFYRETLGLREIIGGLIILIAAILMSKINNREQVVVSAPDPLPD